MDAAALLNRDNMTFVLIEEAVLEADLRAFDENIGYLHYYINSYYRSNINCGKCKERQPAQGALMNWSVRLTRRAFVRVFAPYWAK